MNILSINNLPVSQTTFQARKEKKVRGQKPSQRDTFEYKRDRYTSTEGNSKKLLEAKIKYAEKRLASEQDYLKNEAKSYREKQYVEMTIIRLKQELQAFKDALIKMVAKKA